MCLRLGMAQLSVLACLLASCSLEPGQVTTTVKLTNTLELARFELRHALLDQRDPATSFEIRLASVEIDTDAQASFNMDSQAGQFVDVEIAVDTASDHRIYSFETLALTVSPYGQLSFTFVEDAAGQATFERDYR